MPIDLTGKPIAITGASSGIGAATALACAKAGMPVALGARRADKLETLVRQIESAGGRAFAMTMDVTRPEQCEQLVEQTVSRFGSIYAVYANAGYGEERAVGETTDADLRAMFETNFFGSMNVIRPALARMLAVPGPGPERGHILFCSSCLAKMTVPFVGVYCATKAAQNHVGRAMRLELRPKGVEVSTVHPIGTRTEFFDQMAARSGGSKLTEHSPSWFMQTADFVARCTVACLRRPRAEVWPGVRGRLVRTGMALGNMMPNIADAAMRGMVNRRMFPHQIDATPETPHAAPSPAPKTASGS
jgi:short-subunit dehydrogenase